MLGVPSLAAAQIELDDWFFQIDYGVFADGGGLPTPLQGPVSIDDEGVHEFTWMQEDGVAFAEAAVVVTLLIDEPGGSLSFGGGLDSTATAIVGDNPAYPFEFATAQSFLDYAFLTINVTEPSVLSVVGTPIDLNGVDVLNPGEQLVLDPGFYEIEFSGVGSGSLASAHANESSFDDNVWAFGVNVNVIPAPGSLLVLLAVARARPRRAHGARITIVAS